MSATNCRSCGARTSFPAGASGEREVAGVCPACFKPAAAPRSSYREWVIAEADLRAQLAALERDSLSESDPDRLAEIARRKLLVKEKLTEMGRFLARVRAASATPLDEEEIANSLLRKFEKVLARAYARKPFEDRHDIRGTHGSADQAALFSVLRLVEDRDRWTSVRGVVKGLAEIEGLIRRQLDILPIGPAGRAGLPGAK